MTDDAAKPVGAPVTAVTEPTILRVIAAIAAAFVGLGLVIDGPEAVLEGLIAICLSRDTLLTDYFGIGGVGATLVNAGLLTLCASFVYKASGARIGGAAVACLLLVLGFAFFGKNLLNIWSIVVGVAVYARFRGEPFANHINTAFFGTALSPIFSEILFSSTLPLTASLPLAVATSLLIGFVLAPAAAQLFKAHEGHSLYNMGFTAGIVGVLIVAIYKSYGFVPDPVFVWTTGNNVLIGSFLGALFTAMILLGFFFDRSAVAGVRTVLASTGQSPSDFIALAGFGPALINMGLAGATGMAYILLIGGELNGPVVGAILTIVGFAAYGKHPRNIIPIMIGVYLGSLAKPWGATDPGPQLAALFGTTLAPIAGRFGWHWGIVAGFVHSSAAQTVGPVHGGLNLYNNGFAAGIVAAVVLPVIVAVRAVTQRGREQDPASEQRGSGSGQGTTKR